MVNIPSKETVIEDIKEVHQNEIITDKHNKELSAKQIYRDKETLQITLSHIRKELGRL